MAQIGARFDRRAGLCAATPTPNLPIQMCAGPAEQHVFVKYNGHLVSLFACRGHEPLAYEAGDLLVTVHPVGYRCVDPDSGLWISVTGRSWCTPTPGGSL